MGKELACQKRLYIQVLRSIRKAKPEIVTDLTYKGTSQKSILYMNLHYFTLYVRKRAQKENKKSVEKNHLEVIYNSKQTSASKAR